MFSSKLVFISLLFFIAYNFSTLSHAYIMLPDENKDASLIIAKLDDTIWINCTASYTMVYCYVLNPDGHMIEPTYLNENQGICSLKISVKITDVGKWSCHYSTLANHLETNRSYTVRVAGNVAAVKKELKADLGTQITLRCVKVIQTEPMHYCRFKTPSGISFSIDESVTYHNSILDMYYYPFENRGVRSGGDCSVTVKELKSEHVGEWTCIGGLANRKEYADTIYVDRNPVWINRVIINRALTEWTLWEKYEPVVMFCILIIEVMNFPILIWFHLCFSLSDPTRGITYYMYVRITKKYWPIFVSMYQSLRRLTVKRKIWKKNL